jgi:3-oxoacyl-[acyl-carrier protein] reductase
VAIVDLDEQSCKSVDTAIEDKGGTAVAVAADVSDEQSVTDATAAIADQLGGPTILINNAGITRDNVLRKMSVDDWDAVTAVHLRGNFLFSRAVQAHMREAGWGRIVNLSSVSALGNFGQMNYAAAKAGVQGITKTLAIELGPYGVTVNAVAPGFIESEMTAATATRMGVSFDQLKETFAADIPVRRVGQPQDIAAAIAFFTSEEASFVSGQVLYVAGGPKA